MVGIIISLGTRVLALLVLCTALGGCVSTEELYAEYDAADCHLIANTDTNGAVSLHEQHTDTHFPWEPAVYFEFNSSELGVEEIARLDKSMQVLKAFPGLVLGLQGFTDKRGGAPYNLALAELRVLSVKQYLQSQGIDDARIVLQPIGKALPQIGLDDDTARAVNRRVELMLLDDAGKPLALQYAMK